MLFTRLHERRGYMHSKRKQLYADSEGRCTLEQAFGRRRVCLASMKGGGFTCSGPKCQTSTMQRNMYTLALPNVFAMSAKSGSAMDGDE